MLKARNAHGEFLVKDNGFPGEDSVVFRPMGDTYYNDLLRAGLHTWEGMRPAFAGVATTKDHPCVAAFWLTKALDLFELVIVQREDDPDFGKADVRVMFEKKVVGVDLGPTTPLFLYDEETI